MQKIVGLLGRRGSGKDTAGKILVAAGWEGISFAGPLYREVAEAFNVSVEFLQNRDTKESPLPELALINCTDQMFVSVMLGLETSGTIIEQMNRPRSPREILQRWGTEYRRELFRDDYWLEQARLVITANPNTNYVITDVRYPNEAEMVKSMNGELGRVVRPGLPGGDDPALLHPSETLMLNYPVDIEFINEEGPHGLKKLRQVVSQRFLTADTLVAA